MQQAASKLTHKHARGRRNLHIHTCADTEIRILAGRHAETHNTKHRHARVQSQKTRTETLRHRHRYACGHRDMHARGHTEDTDALGRLRHADTRHTAHETLTDTCTQIHRHRHHDRHMHTDTQAQTPLV